MIHESSFANGVDYFVIKPGRKKLTDEDLLKEIQEDIEIEKEIKIEKQIYELYKLQPINLQGQQGLYQTTLPREIYWNSK